MVQLATFDFFRVFAIHIIPAAMFSTKLVALAFVGTAAAINPVMQMSAGRRVAIQGAGAAAVAAPFLRPAESDAASYKGQYAGNMVSGKDLVAPVISLLDHRGCSRTSSEYTGPSSGTMEDEQVAIIRMDACTPSAQATAAFTASVIGQLRK